MSPVHNKSYTIYVSPESLSDIVKKVTFMEFAYTNIYFLKSYNSEEWENSKNFKGHL